MAAKNTISNYDPERIESTNETHPAGGRAWITEHGREEGCRTCHSQIDVRHVLADNGYVTLCADCRAVYTEGSR